MTSNTDIFFQHSSVCDTSSAQGGVFLLQDASGNVDMTQVLKVVFKFGIGGLFGMTNLEREWQVGRQLALLAEPGKALPGFMQTGAAVVTDSGQFRGDIQKHLCPQPDAFFRLQWCNILLPHNQVTCILSKCRLMPCQS